jgi:hypothetical protein
MPGFPHNLIGLAPLVDAGCRVIFTQTLVIAFDANIKAILIGWRETNGPQLWARASPPTASNGPQLSWGTMATRTCRT